MLENKICYKIGWFRTQDCGFLILIYRSHSFWIFISYMITSAWNWFFMQKRTVVFSIQTSYFLGPIFLACSLNFSRFITHSPQCTAQLGKWRLLLSPSVLGHQVVKQGARQKHVYLKSEHHTANVYRALQGVCRFSLQYLWKRAVRITKKPYTG